MSERHEMQLVISDEYGDIYECPTCKRVLWFFDPEKAPSVVNEGNNRVVHVGGKGGLVAEDNAAMHCRANRVLN